MVKYGKYLNLNFTLKKLKVVNLNNILNIPPELLEELMEALEENVYVTELCLVNTGILDKIAYALAKTLKRNRTLEKVSILQLNLVPSLSMRQIYFFQPFCLDNLN